MSSEFPAHQARNIMHYYESWGSEFWYAKFRDELFETVKNEALKGNNSIVIHSDSWEDNEIKKKYLMSRLISLDYSVKVENDIMTVSW